MVHYLDEQQDRRASARRDYSIVRAVRTADMKLFSFVSYRSIWTEHWLFEYDLRGRRMLSQRRVRERDIAIPDASPCID
jgi:hypothetical protein